jgi:hypothetical protein
LHDAQILIVHWHFRFVLVAYFKFALHVCMLYIFDDTFIISEWICSNCVSIPIYKHYKYIANRFAQLANLLPSAVWSIYGSMINFMTEKVMKSQSWDEHHLYFYHENQKYVPHMWHHTDIMYRMNYLWEYNKLYDQKGNEKPKPRRLGLGLINTHVQIVHIWLYHWI